jgi:hypothetical protein
MKTKVAIDEMKVFVITVRLSSFFFTFFVNGFATATNGVFLLRTRKGIQSDGRGSLKHLDFVYELTATLLLRNT